MLRRLSITNYLLIEELELDLGNGLTIITGETGSGKSILIGALGLVLGERADGRPGARPRKALHHRAGSRCAGAWTRSMVRCGRGALRAALHHPPPIGPGRSFTRLHQRYARALGAIARAGRTPGART
ncbi:MAG: AAA family ATPase [Flavobacteriales bacterium]|nr:AAA family ATPase [Flavobacteriales bacterium]